MFLILSAAYIDQELQSEFGTIPPSFLPLGNKRLFRYQVELAPANEAVYLSIPESYRISAHDKVWLKAHDVAILSIPDGLNLGESLAAAYNLTINEADEHLTVLYGDTLFTQLPFGENVIGVSTVDDNYHWAEIQGDNGTWISHSLFCGSVTNQIVNGYFHFSHPKELMCLVAKAQRDFIAALNLYHSKKGLALADSSSWLDFGHINTYYKSKAQYTTQRSFNQLKITPHWIEKSSSKNGKIAAEAHWFASLPEALRLYTPQYLGSQNQDTKVSYRLEYLYLTALNELFVFAELPSKIWRQILNACMTFLQECQHYEIPCDGKGNNLNQLFGAKTHERLEDFCASRGFNTEQTWSFNGCKPVSVEHLLQTSSVYLPTQAQSLSVLHGDLCFSNILYDFRTNRVKVIDPRGITPQGEKSIYGDIRYDLAKLSHSVLGLYDWIIAGYYDVDISDFQISLSIAAHNKQQEIQAIFLELVQEKFALSKRNLYAMQIQLFLSMLPLHADDLKRQDALFANAFRLYELLIKG